MTVRDVSDDGDKGDTGNRGVNKPRIELRTLIPAETLGDTMGMKHAINDYEPTIVANLPGIKFSTRTSDRCINLWIMERPLGSLKFTVIERLFLFTAKK